LRVSVQSARVPLDCHELTFFSGWAEARLDPGYSNGDGNDLSKGQLRSTGPIYCALKRLSLPSFTSRRGAIDGSSKLTLRHPTRRMTAEMRSIRVAHEMKRNLKPTRPRFGRSENNLRA